MFLSHWFWEHENYQLWSSLLHWLNSANFLAISTDHIWTLQSWHSFKNFKTFKNWDFSAEHSVKMAQVKFPANADNYAYRTSVKSFQMWVTCLRLWGHSSTSELLRWPEWWELYTTSGQGSFRKRSPVGPRFSESLFLDVPGTATEQVRTCGFRRNLSSLDRAPNMRHSVRLNSFESFLVTLPSISSETWEM